MLDDLAIKNNCKFDNSEERKKDKDHVTIIDEDEEVQSEDVLSNNQAGINKN